MEVCQVEVCRDERIILIHSFYIIKYLVSHISIRAEYLVLIPVHTVHPDYEACYYIYSEEALSRVDMVCGQTAMVNRNKTQLSKWHAGLDRWNLTKF